MKPNRKLVRRSFMREVTGGFGAAGAPGAGKPMPAGDHDLNAPEKPGPGAGDKDG